MSKPKLIAVRVEEATDIRLRRAADRGKDPYAPSVSQIVTRGIELALEEIEARTKGKGKR